MPDKLDGNYPSDFSSGAVGSLLPILLPLTNYPPIMIWNESKRQKFGSLIWRKRISPILCQFLRTRLKRPVPSHLFSVETTEERFLTETFNFHETMPALWAIRLVSVHEMFFPSFRCPQDLKFLQRVAIDHLLKYPRLQRSCLQQTPVASSPCSHCNTVVESVLKSVCLISISCSSTISCFNRVPYIASCSSRRDIESCFIGATLLFPQHKRALQSAGVKKKLRWTWLPGRHRRKHASLPLQNFRKILSSVSQLFHLTQLGCPNVESYLIFLR